MSISYYYYYSFWKWITYLVLFRFQFRFNRICIFRLWLWKTHFSNSKHDHYPIYFISSAVTTTDAFNVINGIHTATDWQRQWQHCSHAFAFITATVTRIWAANPLQTDILHEQLKHRWRMWALQMRATRQHTSRFVSVKTLLNEHENKHKNYTKTSQFLLLMGQLKFTMFFLLGDSMGWGLAWGFECEIFEENLYKILCSNIYSPRHVL